MSYAPPSIGSSGLAIPSYSDILAYLIGEFQGIFGSAAYLGPDSADFQEIAVRALQAYDLAQALQVVYLSLNPQTATGPGLDRVGRLIGTARKTATHSSVLMTLTGTAGTTIVSGAVRDINGNVWLLATPATIGGMGTAAIIATAQAAGNVTANPGDISIIATPTAGWTAATNAVAATPGEAVEPDSVYRARLLLSQAKPSLTLVAGTAAAIAAVSGVTRSAVYENPTNIDDSNGNPPHSITCVVEGGSSAEVARAIYDNRGIGCYTNGTTTVTVADAQNPVITMPIRFKVLAYVPVYVSLDVHALAGYTSATTAAIKAAVVVYLNSLGIGQGVVFSELYGAALTARPNPDQPLFSIHAIHSGARAAQTAAAVTSGSPIAAVVSATGIATGQVAVGAGIPDGTTVSGVSGTNVTLSANATASGTAVPLSFFEIGTSDLPVGFDAAAQGSALNILVNLV